MKTLIRNIALIISHVLFSFIVCGQSPVNNDNIYDFNEGRETSIKNLTSFTYKVIEKKVYFKLLVRNLSEDCVFVVERSVEDNDYKAVAIKMGKADNNNVDLLYCFQDTLDIDSDKAYYRLKQVFETSGTFLSEAYVVENEPYYYLADYK